MDKYFTVLAVENRLSYPRAARESFRLQRQQIASYDFVVLARGDALNAPSLILRKSLDRHWLKVVERASLANGLN